MVYLKGKVLSPVSLPLLCHNLLSLVCSMGVERVWGDLASREPAVLEEFESFLSEVVVQMQHNQQDKHKLQKHIKK